MCQKKVEGRKAEKQLNNETAATQLEDSIIRFGKSKNNGFRANFKISPSGEIPWLRLLLKNNSLYSEKTLPSLLIKTFLP